MGKLRSIWLLTVLIAVALAAPKEEEDTTSLETKEKISPDKRQIDVVNEDSGISTWLANNYTQVALSGLAVLLILGGLGYALYHFVYLQHYAVVATTNTSYVQDQGQYGQPNSYAYANYPGYSAYSGRAMTSPWNFTKVLEYIDVAQKTYEGFDWQDLNCQKRTLCELSQKQNEPWGDVGRKLTNSYVYRFLDALDGIPVPKVIQTYLKEYKEAISTGKNSAKDCGQIYAGCKFSIKDVLNKAAAKKKA